MYACIYTSVFLCIYMHRLQWSLIAKKSECVVDPISMLLSQLLSQLRPQLSSSSYMFETIEMGITWFCGPGRTNYRQNAWLVGPGVRRTVQTRGFVDPDVHWTVKTRGFVGPDVRWTVKTCGFVGPGVRGTENTWSGGTGRMWSLGPSSPVASRFPREFLFR